MLYGDISSRLSGDAIDDFEHNDLQGHYTALNTGAFNHFNIVTTPVHTGSYALEQTVVSQSHRIQADRSVITDTPSSPSTFRFWFYVDAASGTARRVYFDFAHVDGDFIDNSGGYQFQIVDNEASIAVLDSNGADAGRLGFQSFTYDTVPNNAWHEVTIYWNQLGGPVTSEDELGYEIRNTNGDILVSGAEVPNVQYTNRAGYYFKAVSNNAAPIYFDDIAYVGDQEASGEMSPTGARTASDYNLTFEDDFTGGSLDSTYWGIGFGFGTTSDNDAADVDPARVSVSNSQLHLEVKSEGDGSTVTQGAVNTKDASGSWNPDGPGVTYEPPIWLEARESPITREGVLPAFWGKPNNEDWPPELDIMEVFHDGDAADTDRVHQNIHYAASGTCGDGSNVQTIPNSYNTGSDVDNRFRVYGALWTTDRLEFYVDGELVHTITDQFALDTLANANCNPFYMMFTNHVNRVGTADLSTAWTEVHDIDWVRLWDYTGSGLAGPEGALAVDSFNDLDIAEYTGDTSGFQTVRSPTVDSTEGALAGAGWFQNRITSTSGLQNYPAKGDEFEWYIRKDSGDATYSLQNTLFGYTDASNFWRAEVQWNEGGQYMDLQSTVGGTDTTQRTSVSNFTLDPNKWYRCHVTWDDGATFGGADGEVTWTLHDAETSASHTVTQTEANLTGTGVGFGTDDGSGPTFYWDEFYLL